ncbi:MAG TPA: hypothetical protein DCG30_08695 [Ruminococcus sp.]|nr:hypothetical protein [Ruminococcus sp.]
MKKFFIFVIVLVLAGTGFYFAKKYYDNEYLPQKILDENIEKQKNLYQAIKPDIPHKDNIPNVTDSQSSEQMTTQPYTAENTIIENITENYDILADAKLVTNDIVGWISIDGTEIDFPVVQSQDNSFYLWRGVDGEENSIGTPFLDYRCDPCFSEYNWIIYGHNIENFQMFGRLQDFMQEDYFNSHKTGTLIADNTIYNVNFFAYLSEKSSSPIYNTVFITLQDRIDYAELILRLARFKNNISAEELSHKRLVLLSTCNFEFEESRGILAGYID